MVLQWQNWQSPRYQELKKREGQFHGYMVDALDRCRAAGDDDWADEQESIQFDVENREVTL
jgi:hypothetical protein